MTLDARAAAKARSRDTLVADLTAEQAALKSILAPLDDAAWSLPTPADGWDVRDQVTHLAFFDGAAARTTADPRGFAVEATRAAEDYDAYHDDAIAQGRLTRPAQVLATWREHAAAFRAAAAAADPGMRVSWYVTEMGLVSLVSARLMETWAHGQDIRDTLGLPPEASDRLRHVAHLGCNALRYAFLANGRPAPADPVRVDLTLPSGAPFTFGPEDAADRVTGEALDFCLAATRRRHPADLRLTAEGPVAEAWLPIVQAYAGPPGPGRRAGQFTVPTAP